MKTIEIMGGLGNQLFQIFTLLAFSYDFDEPIFFSEENLRHGWRKTTYWNTFLTGLMPFLRKNENTTFIMREPGFNYTPIPQVKNKNFKLFGYFQSYKYFDSWKDEIFNLIRLEHKKNGVKNKLQIPFENTVSLHFRIGDYKKIQDHHPIMPNKYYFDALTELSNKTNKKDWNIMYVCEEEDLSVVSERIKEFERIFPSMTFERLDGKLQDWEQMLAMSLCRHHVIANSSFSWFGAYFNTSQDKLVFYPSVWFGPSQGYKNMCDMFIPTWFEIKV